MAVECAEDDDAGGGGGGDHCSKSLRSFAIETCLRTRLRESRHNGGSETKKEPLLLPEAKNQSSQRCLITK